MPIRQSSSAPRADGRGNDRRARPKAAAAAAPLDALRLEVLGKFREVYLAARTHFDAVSQTLGVSGTELWAMWELQQRPDQRVSDLAVRLNVRQSTVSNLVERLSRTGLLSRIRADPDRRVVRLRLTRSGGRLLAGAPQPAQGVLQTALEQLSERDVKRLRDALTVLVSQMEKRVRGAGKVPLTHM